VEDSFTTAEEMIEHLGLIYWDHNKEDKACTKYQLMVMDCNPATDPTTPYWDF
jgi:hypothetical protein